MSVVCPSAQNKQDRFRDRSRPERARSEDNSGDLHSGVPTDEQGTSTRAVQHEFWNELKALSKLPVKLIIRLCTDNEDVMNVYNKLDHQKESIDVLDDYWGEVRPSRRHLPYCSGQEVLS